jgi:hypothetical protein
VSATSGPPLSPEPVQVSSRCPRCGGPYRVDRCGQPSRRLPGQPGVARLAAKRLGSHRLDDPPLLAQPSGADVRRTRIWAAAEATRRPPIGANSKYAEAPGDYLSDEDYSGEIQNPLDPRRVPRLWVQNISCDEGRKLADEAATGGLPNNWGCAATAIACENANDPSQRFLTSADCLPGETQPYPGGPCRPAPPPPPTRCSSRTIPRIVTPQGAGYVDLKAENVTCAVARGGATTIANCAPNCEPSTQVSGLTCINPRSETVVCTSAPNLRVSFRRFFADL